MMAQAGAGATGLPPNPRGMASATRPTPAVVAPEFGAKDHETAKSLLQ